MDFDIEVEKRPVADSGGLILMTRPESLCGLAVHNADYITAA